jgi:uncharacterized protein (DUF4415 family)
VSLNQLLSGSGADALSDVDRDDPSDSERQSTHSVNIMDAVLQSVAMESDRHAKSIQDFPTIAACEECPSAAVVSRVVANRERQLEFLRSAELESGQSRGSPAVERAHPTVKHVDVRIDDKLVEVHLMLKKWFFEAEKIIGVEAKTRSVAIRIYEMSWEKLLRFEVKCKEMAFAQEKRRAIVVQQCEEFQDKENIVRRRILKAEGTSWTSQINEFIDTYKMLEVGMIAQYTTLRALRQSHAEALRAHGFAADEYAL